MAEPIKISTGKYRRSGKVEIDGHSWSVKLPGAGTELRLSQAFRKSKLYSSRIELVDKKIDGGKATEADLDKYEEYCKEYEQNEKFIFDFFASMFSDGTPDNTEVKKWVNDTPTAIIQMAFEDIKGQANPDKQEKEETDGQDEPSGSS